MKTFVKNIDDLRAHVQVESGASVNVLTPFINKVHETVVISRFGRTFVEQLAAKYHDAPETLTDAEKTVVFLLQAIDVHLGLAAAVPYLTISFSGSGIRQLEMAASKPVYNWQAIKYENAQLEDGHNAIDSAIAALWSFRNDAQFAAWKNSTAETKSRQLLINTASEFHEYSRINSSRRVFEMLMPFMEEAENIIVDLIGVAFYNLLKSQISGFEITANNLIALSAVNRCVARKSVVLGYGNIPVQVTANGLMVVSAPGNNTDKINDASQADDSRIERALASLNSSYQSAVDVLRRVLNDPDKYPLYTEYVASATTPDENTNLDKPFVVL